MAYLGLRSFSRSQSIRIDNQLITQNTTAFVNLSDANAQKEFAQHSAIGAVYQVTHLANTFATNPLVAGGGIVTQPVTTATTEVVSPGTFWNSVTNTYSAFPGSTVSTPNTTTSGQAMYYLISVSNTGASSTTLSSALATSGAITSLPVAALTVAIPSGQSIVVTSGSNTQTFVSSAAAAVGATAIAVISATPNFAYPIGSAVANQPIEVTAGTAATAGSETVPSTPTGETSLATVHFVNGSTVATIAATAPLS